MKMKLYPIVVSCSEAILFVFTKWAHVFHDAILNVPKRFSLDFHMVVEKSFRFIRDIDERIGESRNFFKTDFIFAL